MKVIFLDFDGVLNSEASFRWEDKKGTQEISNTLSPVCCSNLQYIIENVDNVKVVISSTWRKLHTFNELKKTLSYYKVSVGCIVGITPSVLSGDRGHEISLWLEKNPEVKKYAVLDDDNDAGTALYMAKGVNNKRGVFCKTTWDDGLLLSQAKEVVKFLNSK